MYVVAGSSGQVSGGTLDHPVMVSSLNLLGSLVLDIVGARLDARFLDDLGAVRDSFTILKGGALDVPVDGARTLRIDTPNPNPGRDRQRFAIVDNNSPNKVQWFTREEFYRHHSAGGRWVVVLDTPAPVPKPVYVNYWSRRR